MEFAKKFLNIIIPPGNESRVIEILSKFGAIKDNFDVSTNREILQFFSLTSPLWKYIQIEDKFFSDLQDSPSFFESFYPIVLNSILHSILQSPTLIPYSELIFIHHHYNHLINAIRHQCSSLTADGEKFYNSFNSIMIILECIFEKQVESSVSIVSNDIEIDFTKVSLVNIGTIFTTFLKQLKIEEKNQNLLHDLQVIYYSISLF